MRWSTLHFNLVRSIGRWELDGAAMLASSDCLWQVQWRVTKSVREREASLQSRRRTLVALDHTAQVALGWKRPRQPSCCLGPDEIPKLCLLLENPTKARLA
jgi:hypothetical protein